MTDESKNLLVAGDVDYGPDIEQFFDRGERIEVQEIDSFFDIEANLQVIEVDDDVLHDAEVGEDDLSEVAAVAQVLERDERAKAELGNDDVTRIHTRPSQLEMEIERQSVIRMSVLVGGGSSSSPSSAKTISVSESDMQEHGTMSPVAREFRTEAAQFTVHDNIEEEEVKEKKYSGLSNLDVHKAEQMLQAIQKHAEIMKKRTESQRRASAVKARNVLLGELDDEKLDDVMQYEPLEVATALGILEAVRINRSDVSINRRATSTVIDALGLPQERVNNALHLVELVSPSGRPTKEMKILGLNRAQYTRAKHVLEIAREHRNFVNSRTIEQKMSSDKKFRDLAFGSGKKSATKTMMVLGISKEEYIRSKEVLMVVRQHKKAMEQRADGDSAKSALKLRKMLQQGTTHHKPLKQLGITSEEYESAKRVMRLAKEHHSLMQARTEEQILKSKNKADRMLGHGSTEEKKMAILGISKRELDIAKDIIKDATVARRLERARNLIATPTVFLLVDSDTGEVQKNITIAVVDRIIHCDMGNDEEKTFYFKHLNRVIVEPVYGGEQHVIMQFDPRCTDSEKCVFKVGVKENNSHTGEELHLRGSRPQIVRWLDAMQLELGDRAVLITDVTFNSTATVNNGGTLSMESDEGH